MTIDVLRPEKVGWIFNFKAPSVVDSINSKSLRKIFRQADELLLQHHITWEYKAVSKEEYLKWLDYYREKMSKKNYRIVATEEWYDQKLKENKQVFGLFFYQNENLVGSGIISKKENSVSFAFKASEPFELSNKDNATLGAFINYYYLQAMHKEGVEVITGGRSRNAFGVLNSYGYLEHKVSFYTPYLPEDTEMLNEVPLDENGMSFFYSFDEKKQPTLNFVHPKVLTKNIDINRFNKNNVPVREIIY